jgi:hypothetical protein
VLVVVNEEKLGDSHELGTIEGAIEGAKRDGCAT